MRKMLIALGILTAAAISISVSIHTISHTSAQMETPAYAKWGKIAVKETQTKYPHAEIIDYLYMGNESIGNSTLEKFKLWLKEDTKEFGVFVTIEYETKTGKLIIIKFQETSR